MESLQSENAHLLTNSGPTPFARPVSPSKKPIAHGLMNSSPHGMMQSAPFQDEGPMMQSSPHAMMQSAPHAMMQSAPHAMMQSRMPLKQSAMPSPRTSERARRLSIEASPHNFNEGVVAAEAAEVDYPELIRKVANASSSQKEVRDALKGIYDYLDTQSKEPNLQSLQHQALVGILPVCLTLAKTSPSADVRGMVYGTLGNIAFMSEDNSTELMDSGIMEICMADMQHIRTNNKPEIDHRLEADSVTDDDIRAKKLGLTLINNSAASSWSRQPRLIKAGFLQYCRERLEDPKEIKSIVVDVITCLISLSFNAECRDAIQSAGLPPLLAPHAKAEFHPVGASIVLANVCGGEENREAFSLDNSFVDNLVSLLRATLGGEDYKNGRWRLWKVVLAVQNLALNDTNKVKLVSGGVLPLLVKSFKADKHPNIPLYVTGALWNLAFNADNKAKMQSEPGLLELLQELKANPTPAVAKNASGVWFQLFGHGHTDAAAKRKTDEPQKEETKSGGMWDVMMSYNWASQPVVVALARKLQRAGLKVWIDVDQMSGSTLEAMAEAVENSKLVIVGLSKKYKDSANCRTEAQYAFQLGKQIIPIMMQTQYKADGWLGAMLGTALWFDCTALDKMEESYPNLFREVKKFADRPDLVAPSAPTPAATGPTFAHGTIIPASALAPPTASDGANSAANRWTIDEVCGWLSSNGLTGFVKTVRKHELDGKAVVTLATLLRNATDLRVLDKELGIGKFVDQLKFCAAIRTLL